MGEVWLCIVMSICVIAFFCLFYNRIFAVTFDESFTRAIGKNAGAYNLALAVIIDVIISACNESGGLPAHHGASGIPCTFSNASYV